MSAITVESVVASVVRKLRTASRSASPSIGMTSTKVEETIEEVVKEELEITPIPTTTPKKRARKTKEPIVYDIPSVEVLPTTFKGRLGYVSLNAVLRAQKPSVYCSRTTRIKKIEEDGMDVMKLLGLQNCRDLLTMIEWNSKHHIFFMRMSSDMFCFASHKEYGYSLQYAAKELKACGDLAKKYSMRLTTHINSFCQLGSNNPDVVVNSTRDLAYHVEMMNLMGLGKDSVIIVHVGGMYGDKAATLVRFRENYANLPQAIKDRVVLENDEICYNVDDLLPVCEDLNIPLVLDYHHDWIFPSSKTVAELMPRILATFAKKGIKPKQHLSSPRKGAVTIMEKRAHSDRILTLPDCLPVDMDLMLEAKDHEQAVFHLYRIYNLHPVIHEDLRPPAEEESLLTAGRKSNKKKKVKGEEGEEGEGEDGEREDGEEASPSKKSSPKKSPVKAAKVTKVTKVKVEITKVETGLVGSEMVDGEAEEEKVVVKQTRSPRKTPVKKVKKVETESEEEEEAVESDSDEDEVVEKKVVVKKVVKKVRETRKTSVKKVSKIESSEEEDAVESEVGEEDDDEYLSDAEEVMPKKKNRKIAA